MGHSTCPSSTSPSPPSNAASPTTPLQPSPGSSRPIAFLRLAPGYRRSHRRPSSAAGGSSTSDWASSASARPCARWRRRCLSSSPGAWSRARGRPPCCPRHSASCWRPSRTSVAPRSCRSVGRHRRARRRDRSHLGRDVGHRWAAGAGSSSSTCQWAPSPGSWDGACWRENVVNAHHPAPGLPRRRALSVALASLVLAITQGPSWGWSSARVIARFAVSAVLGLAFLYRLPPPRRAGARPHALSRHDPSPSPTSRHCSTPWDSSPCCSATSSF